MTENNFSPLLERIEKRAACRALLGSFLFAPAALVSSFCGWLGIVLAVAGIIAWVHAAYLFDLAEKNKKIRDGIT